MLRQIATRLLAAMLVASFGAAGIAGAAVAKGPGNGPNITRGAPGRGTLPKNRPLVTLQVARGKAVGANGTALLPRARRPLKRLFSTRLSTACTVNFSYSVKLIESFTEVDNWYGGIGCARKMYLFGTAYLQETATVVDAAGQSYNKVSSSALSGQRQTFVQKPPTPTLLYIRHLVNIYFPNATTTGTITVNPAKGTRLNSASKCVTATFRGHGVGVHCELYTNRFGLT